MANREIGEVSFKIGTGDQAETYTVRFGAYSIAALEDKLNRPMLSIAQELDKPAGRRVGTVLAALWAGLQEHHPEVDDRQAARFIDELGFVPSAKIVADGLTLAFPPATKGAAAGGVANPPNRKARRATAKATR